MAGVEAWALVDDVATCPENIPGVREPPERPPHSARGDEGGLIAPNASWDDSTLGGIDVPLWSAGEGLLLCRPV